MMRKCTDCTGTGTYLGYRFLCFHSTVVSSQISLGVITLLVFVNNYILSTMQIAAALAFLLAAPAADAFVSKCSNSAKDTALFAETPVRAPRLPPKYMDNKGLDHIFEKNQEWKNAKKVQDKKFFTKLGKTHTPDYMYIGM